MSRTCCIRSSILLGALLTIPVADTWAQTAAPTDDAQLTWQRFFTEDGPVTTGWVVQDWRGGGRPPKAPVTWNVVDGVLYGTGRYTWCDTDREPCWIGTNLLTDRDYTNFVLELEFKSWFGTEKTANGGIQLRRPIDGSRPSLEVQITDEGFERKYFPCAKAAEFTGSIYLVSAPLADAYRPRDWNRYRIEARGSLLRVWLNGELIQDLNLDTMTEPTLVGQDNTCNYTPTGTSAAERSRTGRIGLQDLSEFGDAMLYRNVRIAELP